MHTGVRAAVAGLSLLLAGCGTQAPCNVCPAVEGTYDMQWAMTTLSGNCPDTLTATPSQLVVTRTGSRMQTSLGAYRLDGTLYDSLDFTLSSLVGLADAGSQTLRLQGFAVAPGRVDGGGAPARLEGRLTASTDGAEGAACNLTRQFVGVRQ